MGKKSWIILIFLMMFVLSDLGVLALSPSDEKPPEIIPLERLPQETSQIKALRKEIETYIEAYSSRMIEMNDWMYHNPEIGFKEFKASKMMGEELKKHGFDVKFGVEGLDENFNDFVQEKFGEGGLKTAFVAKYKGSEEHPVVCFMIEADALRAEKGPFHGCQHNQQGPVAIGSAIALSKVLEKHGLKGSVWAIHAPAEEIAPPAKYAMTKAGFFDGVDFMIRSHGTPQAVNRVKGGIGNCCMLDEVTIYEFHGKPAHGTRAWLGNDSFDAARIFFTAVDMLREHSEPTFRFMGTVISVGNASNVVNDYVEIDHEIRNSDRTGMEALQKKLKQVHTIAKAAAMATFTDVKIRHYGSYYNGIECAWLQAVAWNYTKEYGDEAAMTEELDDPVGWDESGIGAVNVPGVQIRPAVANVPQATGHSYENAAKTISAVGHEGLIQTAKIGAAVGLRLLLDPDMRTKVKEEHARWQKYGLEKGLITKDMIRN